MPQIEILNVPTDAQTFDDAMRLLVGWANGRLGRYVCACPVYTLMMCLEQPEVMRAVASADMVAADGMPIVWLQRRLGYPAAERIYGPDVMLHLCGVPGLRHYFWGGAPGVVERLAAALRARFPAIDIAGMGAPPVAPLGAQPDPDAIARINDAGAAVVWVGLGSPKQDVWMMQHRPHLNAPLLIGVGAAFDIVSGTRRQAPRWMRENGLEWAFRLAQEPRRLARRYLVYNPRFVWRVIKHYGMGLR